MYAIFIGIEYIYKKKFYIHVYVFFIAIKILKYLSMRTFLISITKVSDSKNQQNKLLN